MLSGKLIVVTGVASGIGAESARLLRERGAHVIGIDVKQPSQYKNDFVCADLSNPATIDAAIQQIPDGISGLCNIAGLPPTSPESLVLKVNCIGLKWLTLGLIEKMADDASITNVASLAGIEWPNSKLALKAFDSVDFDNVSGFCQAYDIVGARSYFFSKEYIIFWTLRNRWTWRDRGIRMNCVSPGPVETPILPDFLATLGKRAEEDARLMDRPGRVSDIAPVIAFLQSQDSEWLRGANLTVDGGMAAHVQLAQNDLLDG